MEYRYKIILIGDGAVGKTSIRRCYMGEQFQSDYIKTIGADFASKKTNCEGYEVYFQIWDLAGQPSFQRVQTGFYKGCVGTLVVYDVTAPETLKSLKSWIEVAINNSHNSIQIFIIIGNKIDLQRKVTYQEGLTFTNDLARIHNTEMHYYETSAVTGANIEKVFNTLAHSLLIKNKVIPAKSGPISKSTVMIENISASTLENHAKTIAALEQRVQKLEDEIQAIKTIVQKLLYPK
jgi:small GTP-binding protein